MFCVDMAVGDIWGILLARGVGGVCGQITPGHWDCIRVNCGHVFANTVRCICNKIVGRVAFMLFGT